MKRRNIRKMMTFLFVMVALFSTKKVSAASNTYSDFEYESNGSYITITKYNGNDEVVTIPDTIEKLPVLVIGDWAFYRNSNVKRVILPNTIQIIRQYAFRECRGLEFINFPSSIKSIGMASFMSTALREITLPEKLRFIGPYAFYNCVNNTSFHINGVTDADYYTVDGVLYKGDELLYYPSAKPDKVFTIPINVKTLSVNAFSSMVNLTTIIVPENVESICNEAFMDYAYAGRTKKTIIFRHNNVTSAMKIYSQAFCGMADGTQIMVNNEVVKTWIESYVQDTIYNSFGTVTVEVAPKAATAINLVEKELVLNTGESYKLSWSQAPFDTTDSVTWTTSDSSLVEVNSVTGALKAADKKTGTCTITGKDSSGNVATCKVEVQKKVDKFYMTLLNGAAEITSIKLNRKGSVSDVKVNIEPGYSTLKGEVIWSNSDSSIIDVVSETTNNNERAVYAKAAGKATITAKVETIDGIIMETTLDVYVAPDLSTCTIEIPKDSYEYTGSAIKPAVTLKQGNSVLAEGVDYTVSYSNNKAAGKALITVSGIGRYSGTITKEFTIEGKNFNSADVQLADVSYKFTGQDIKPNVIVMLNGVELKANQDYKVSYKDNRNAGTAKVVVTGAGEYLGAVEKSFTIVKGDFSAVTMSLAKYTYDYTGADIRPSVSGKYGTVTLKNGTDYKVSYQSNKAAGTARVVITGINNFTGSRVLTFKINRKSITGFSFSKIKDYQYTGKNIKPGVTVKNGSKTLKNGTDYRISYQYNKNCGKAQIIVTGINGYTGSKKITFNIVPRKPSIKVKAGKKKAEVSWKKLSEASGYEVYRATSKNGKYSKVSTLTKSKKVTYTDKKGLKSKKTYYYKVRAYKTVNGKKIYGSYSKVVSCKVK